METASHTTINPISPMNFCMYFNSKLPCPLGSECTKSFVHSKERQKWVQVLYKLGIYFPRPNLVLCKKKEEHQLFFNHLTSLKICHPFYILGKCNYGDNCDFFHTSIKDQKNPLRPQKPEKPTKEQKEPQKVQKDKKAKQTPKPEKPPKEQILSSEDEKPPVQTSSEESEPEDCEKVSKKGSFCNRCLNEAKLKTPANCLFDCGHQIFCIVCAQKTLMEVGKKCTTCWSEVNFIKIKN